MEEFNPLPTRRRSHNVDLSDLDTLAAVCARVLLATSIVQRWEARMGKMELGPDGTYVRQPSANPLIKLLKVPNNQRPTFYIR